MFGCVLMICGEVVARLRYIVIHDHVPNNWAVVSWPHGLTDPNGPVRAFSDLVRASDISPPCVPQDIPWRSKFHENRSKLTLNLIVTLDWICAFSLTKARDTFYILHAK